MPKSKEKQVAPCLCGCGSKSTRRIRGVCPNCRQVQIRRVARDEIDEDELVRLGLLNPSKQGRKGLTAFDVALMNRSEARQK